MTDDYLVTLNEEQRRAVEHHGTPLLILAGAGSGKTRVITVKIAHFIRSMGVDPHSILAVTFTNKAANEMKERAAELSPAARDTMIRTFHSFGAWLVRRNAHLLDLSSSFTIYDDDDAVTLLRSIYPEENRGTLRQYYRMISRAKDYGLGPDDDLSVVSADPELPSRYRAYEERRRQIGNLDHRGECPDILHLGGVLFGKGRQVDGITARLGQEQKRQHQQAESDADGEREDDGAVLVTVALAQAFDFGQPGGQPAPRRGPQGIHRRQDCRLHRGSCVCEAEIIGHDGQPCITPGPGELLSLTGKNACPPGLSLVSTLATTCNYHTVSGCANPPRPRCQVKTGPIH
ncbi:MAG: UvrD-helicase domain-containing protein [Spirochaetes bacterium]|jgi:hypothetical protein|nr:UvrD-helicase domain-containing protein [Spirochaetota bacterium]